jgi:hypothetical protein
MDILALRLNGDLHFGFLDHAVPLQVWHLPVP